MNNCPTCGAPKPNDDWEWSEEHLWNLAPGLLKAAKDLLKALARLNIPEPTPRGLPQYEYARECVLALGEIIKQIEGRDE